MYEHKIKPDRVRAHDYTSCSLSQDFRGCKGTKESPCVYGGVGISQSLHSKSVMATQWTFGCKKAWSSATKNFLLFIFTPTLKRDGILWSVKLIHESTKNSQHYHYNKNCWNCSKCYQQRSNSSLPFGELPFQKSLLKYSAFFDKYIRLWLKSRNTSLHLCCTKWALRGC